MKRWSIDGETENPKIDAFLEEIWALCERHGLALSHEDAHGAFMVVPLREGNRDWLMEAHDRVVFPEHGIDAVAATRVVSDPDRLRSHFRSITQSIDAHRGNK